MAHYKGAASEGTRAANLLKKREKQREELEKLKQKISEDHGVKPKFESIEHKFSTNFDVVEEQLRSSTIEEQLRSSTIGLVTLDEMREKRDIIVREREMQIAAKLPTDDADHKRKGKHKKNMGGTLSFNLDDDDENEDENGEDSPPPVARKKRKLGKNPTVDTSFLPDRDREEAERAEREALRREWSEKQEKIKSEEITITYSYWDGSGHRKQVKMQKGNTIYQLLQKCLESLRKDFPELRGMGADSLMYIKEDLIIPQHYTFYDFIINQARGKSGPLFKFDVHEDVRLINDAMMEKDESHAGKVVMRSWYERNKHIFPASRWEPYDPEKKWETYTISDKKK